MFVTMPVQQMRVNQPGGNPELLIPSEVVRDGETLAFSIPRVIYVGTFESPTQFTGKKYSGPPFTTEERQLLNRAYNAAHEIFQRTPEGKSAAVVAQVVVPTLRRQALRQSITQSVDGLRALYGSLLQKISSFSASVKKPEWYQETVDGLKNPKIGLTLNQVETCLNRLTDAELERLERELQQTCQRWEVILSDVQKIS